MLLSEQSLIIFGMVSLFHDSDVGMLICDVPKLSTKLFAVHATVDTVSDLDTSNDCDTVLVLSDAVNAETSLKISGSGRSMSSANSLEGEHSITIFKIVFEQSSFS